MNIVGFIFSLESRLDDAV